jgi:hypothetical protein
MLIQGRHWSDEFGQQVFIVFKGFTKGGQKAAFSA